jgi:hypothetical protein
MTTSLVVEVLVLIHDTHQVCSRWIGPQVYCDSHVIHLPATLRSSAIYWISNLVTQPCRLQSRITTSLVAPANLFRGVHCTCTGRSDQSVRERTPNPRMIYTMLQGGTTQSLISSASSFFMEPSRYATRGTIN